MVLDLLQRIYKELSSAISIKYFHSIYTKKFIYYENQYIIVEHIGDLIMIEVYSKKERKYIMILEDEDDYISQQDWDEYYWDKISEEETYIPRRN